MSHDPSAPLPPSPSSAPTLSPSFCFNQTALRDFLRLSRSTTDDSLSLHLNALLQPSRRPFSTSSNQYNNRSRRQIPGSVCRQFKNETLFPSWWDREKVLSYCEDVARNPASEPDPAQEERRQVVMRMPSDKLAPATSLAPEERDEGLDTWGVQEDERLKGQTQRRSRNYFGMPQVVDERTDPYSARDYTYTREPRAEMLRDVLLSERGVERIVRARTWSLLGERCLDEEGGESAGTARGSGWDEEWKRWMQGRR